MRSFKSAIIIILFATIVTGVYMYINGDLQLNKAKTEAGVNNTGFLKTEEEFRTKLAELRIEQDKMRRRKTLMIQRKDTIVKELKDKGVTSTSDISDKSIKYQVTNLKKSVNGIKDVDESIGDYQKGIDAIEAMLDKLEQDRLSAEVAISDEKAEELSIMLLDLDDKLLEDNNLFEDEELRDILGSELGE